MDTSILNIIWQYLPVVDFISLSLTNSQLLTYYQDQSKWNYFIKRDYKVDYYLTDARREYIHLLHNDYICLLFNFMRKDLLYPKDIKYLFENQPKDNLFVITYGNVPIFRVYGYKFFKNNNIIINRIADIINYYYDLTQIPKSKLKNQSFFRGIDKKYLR